MTATAIRAGTTSRSPERLPVRSYPRSTLLLASLGLFMTALDTLVVTTALPVLRTSLHASISGLEWTVNAYNLAFACFLLTGAALGDRFGRRRMFTIGIGAFTAASAAAAVSPTVGALIAARTAQGAAAAIVMPLTLTLISAAFPADRRGAAIGLWGGICGIAVAAGPVVGGAVVDGVSWHWIFWLNVPVGLVLVPAARARLTESYGPRPRLDLPGLTLAAGAALTLCWGAVRAADDGWTGPRVLALIAIGTVLSCAFLAAERRSDHAMLPLALFRSRGFAGANAVSFFMYAGLSGVLFLMAQYLQTALGYSPLAAGLRLLPWTAPPLVIAPIAGTLADRYGNRPLVVAGLALQSIGYGGVAVIAAVHPGYGALGVAFTVAGIGTSLCFPTVANAVMGSVPPEEAGVASGTNSMLRELGGVFGVAVLASVFTTRGSYATPHTFVAGFTVALWAGAALTAVGITAALAIPGFRRGPGERPAPGTATAPVAPGGAAHRGVAAVLPGGKETVARQAVTVDGDDGTRP